MGDVIKLNQDEDRKAEVLAALDALRDMIKEEDAAVINAVFVVLTEDRIVKGRVNSQDRFTLAGGLDLVKQDILLEDYIDG